MDSVKRSAVTPSKSRLARAIAKAMHIHAFTGIAPDDDGIRKTKSRDKTEKDHFKHFEVSTFKDEDEEELLQQDDRIVKEAFLSKLFAAVSAVKAAYAEMQFAQSPHDADGIQAADKIVISELKYLSELKRSYLKKQLDEASPATMLVLSEIKEQKSTLKIYEVTAKKLDSLLKLKDSETFSLKGKLSEANKANKLLERRLSSSGQFVIPDNIQLSDLRAGNFLSYYRQTLKYIRSFVQVLITEMRCADWDLDAAGNSIEPGTCFRKPSHKCFAFESFVCKQMFDGFNCPDFSPQKPMPERDKRRSLFFNRFVELKSAKPADYLAWKPKSAFATFCRTKYLRLVHPRMEASLFGSLDQRDSMASGGLPETPFFLAFSEMAKRVWLLHCLALSFEPEISVFQVKKGSRFSEVYMESLSEDGLLLSEPQVALSVVPGFVIGKTVVQCQVYLC
ncbi:protein GRAVITROPIC IN THE LIGHT 1-like isoform X2 [Salvia miltiorrhiza]|nr:protein GRAVITROPIC IN THE LIGHT 1-like isoform X2 [Salvia miltiorrhiza]XP_057766412.1 protein GRAVITROPIC IN THE LIGHT 1-like isoform X2 [Salvia miltiorrhiza]XP_057766413.1 protein GRAVITROPIC IN THE LIGHT 1-like isoform X2 [Salvia miltiorrhiza]